MPYPCCCEPTVCEVDFSFVQTGAGLAFDFTGAADPVVTSWDWDFGDGGTSSVQSPSHTYATQGVYVVTLTIEKSGGATCEKQRTIHAYNKCTACTVHLPQTISVTLPALSDNICTYCAELMGTYLLTKLSDCGYQYGPVNLSPLCEICDDPSPAKQVTLTITAVADSFFDQWTISIIRDYGASGEESCRAVPVRTYTKSIVDSICGGAQTANRSGPSTDNDCNGWPATIDFIV